MSSTDNLLLRLATNRKDWDDLNQGLPVGGLLADTVGIWKDVGKFYAEFPDVQDMDVKLFRTWYTEFQNAAMSTDKLELMASMIDRMAEPVPEVMRAGLTQRMLEAELAYETTVLVSRYSAGEEIDLPMELEALQDRYKDKLVKKTEDMEVHDDLDALMDQGNPDVGIQWRLEVLRRTCRRLQPGDAVIWAARPDRGKTTGLVSEASYWVPQIIAEHGTFAESGRLPVMWINNEGEGGKIKARYIQSAVDVDGLTMQAMHREGKLAPALVEVLGEDWKNDFKVFNAHGAYSHDIERLIKKFKPHVVIFDMIDNIKFSGMGNNGGQRTDQILEEMYKWARDCAVKYKFVSIATSQISSGGEGEAFPNMGMLKDSKTGKQGACDIIIMWGDVGNPDVRYCGIPKNKLKRTGVPGDPREQVIFDGEHARLRDAPN
ncbi:DNA helicase [Xanthomonas phage SB3]|uniref:DNA helicase n=1 Tax=Xanthomonas phage SB3 TaxID=3117472 RepID=A0ABZ2GUJ8_9CAUD